MLCCKIASVVANYLHHHSLFHAIIEFKGLTFLAAEAPDERVHELDRQVRHLPIAPSFHLLPSPCAHNLLCELEPQTIKQIVQSNSVQTLCSDGCTIGTALKLLEGQVLMNDTTYAVIDKEERFEGTLSLVHLLELIDANLDGKALEHPPLEQAELAHAHKTKDVCTSDAANLVQRCRDVEGGVDAPLSLKPVVNLSAYSVRDTMSILRAYNIFRTMGCRNMVVVDIGNKVVGMLTRNDLVDICHPPHDEH